MEYGSFPDGMYIGFHLWSSARSLLSYVPYECTFAWVLPHSMNPSLDTQHKNHTFCHICRLRAIYWPLYQPICQTYYKSILWWQVVDIIIWSLHVSPPSTGVLRGLVKVLVQVMSCSALRARNICKGQTTHILLFFNFGV